MPSTPNITLLFAHGNGFCKQVWDPIVRRLQASPLLRQPATSTEFVTFDLPFHGANRDESVPATLLLDDSSTPRVKHPSSAWADWAPAAVLEQVQALRRAQDENKLPRTKLIGVGHSMGAASLWKAEVQHPGTFDGLVLFEPIYMLRTKESRGSGSFLVSVTLKRESKWPSREAAVAHIEGYRNFASWDREMLRAYMDGALVQDDASSSTVLATHPHIEAAIYSGVPLELTEEEVGRPRCPIRLLSGGRSRIVLRPAFEPMVAAHPHIYGFVRPIDGASHVMLMEKPDESATQILAELAQLAPFRTPEVGGGDRARL
ncbi:hypothetical protein PybrP1_005121 [[Pythium] brassicae (nom. inval.)]|nr:hypothetical protein PybrP1_005121 [[Pythium] brassicae (nom. inval.)]